MPVPAPHRPVSVEKTMGLMVLGIIGIAILLFALVRELNPPAAPVQLTAKSPADQLFSDVRAEGEFRNWLEGYRALDPYLNVTEFSVTHQGAIRTAEPPSGKMTPETDELREPRTNRYVYSPDGRRFIDVVSGYSTTTGDVVLYDRMGDGAKEVMARCEAPCRYDTAFWIDDDRVVLLGAIQAVTDAGTPLCLTAGNGDEERCYERLVVVVYDLAAGTEWRYGSESHFFPIEPFAADRRRVWLSGLTPFEKAALGAVAAEEFVVATGLITDTAASAGVLSLRLADGNTMLVALAPETKIFDEQGKPFDRGLLLPGFEIEAKGLPSGSLTIVPVEIKVTKALNIVILEPKADEVVGQQIEVSGVARVYENTVSLRVTNLRTGRVIVDTFTTGTAETGMFGPFAATLTVPSTRARSGDELTLEVYQSSAEDGRELDLVSVRLRYAP